MEVLRIACRRHGRNNPAKGLQEHLAALNRAKAGDEIVVMCPACQALTGFRDGFPVPINRALVVMGEKRHE